MHFFQAESKVLYFNSSNNNVLLYFILTILFYYNIVITYICHIMFSISPSDCCKLKSSMHGSNGNGIAVSSTTREMLKTKKIY